MCEFGYKTGDGKIKGMKIFGFGDHKDVFDVASKLVPGDVCEAQFRQNDKGYWEFSKLTPTGAKEAVAKAETAAGPARGNWETPEERAAKQVMIVRQSSLSNAIALCAAQQPKGVEAGVDGILELARMFEAYVLDKPTGKIE